MYRLHHRSASSRSLPLSSLFLWVDVCTQDSKMNLVWTVSGWHRCSSERRVQISIYLSIYLPICLCYIFLSFSLSSIYLSICLCYIFLSCSVSSIYLSILRLLDASRILFWSVLISFFFVPSFLLSFCSSCLCLNLDTATWWWRSGALAFIKSMWLSRAISWVPSDCKSSVSFFPLTYV